MEDISSLLSHYVIPFCISQTSLCFSIFNFLLFFSNVCVVKYEKKCQQYTEPQCRTEYRDECVTLYRDKCVDDYKDVEEKYVEDECIEVYVNVCEKGWVEQVLLKFA